MDEITHIQKVAESIAVGAGEILLNYRGKAQITKTKSHVLDIVTEADEASEKYILTELKKYFPTHDYLSEEAGEKKTSSPYRWVIDPLDGTKEFARQLPLFAVNLALQYYEQIIVGVIFAPITKELYSCAKGLGSYLSGRELHVSTQYEISQAMIITHPLRGNLDNSTFDKHWTTIGVVAKKAYRLRAFANDIFALAWIALGAYEALYVPVGYPNWWDIAPGLLMVEEAGGRITTAQGNPLTEDSYKDEGLLASNGKIHAQLLKIISGSSNN